MRRMFWIGIALVAVSSVGCHRDKYNLAATFDEEYVLPPDEARFNNPPESGYKKPAKKRDTDVRNGPGIGNGGGGGSGLGFGRGGGGFNGQ
jgi:hypothetical protein